MKYIVTGILFAALWGSAGVAGKIGLQHGGQPLWMSNVRYGLAAAILIGVIHGMRRTPLPTARHWRPLMVYGFLNNAMYMALFVYGLQGTSAGISTLSVVLNPLIISVLSAFWLQKKISRYTWAGLALGMVGVGVATYPLLRTAQVSGTGMLFLLASMLCYSVGTIFYTQQKWEVSKWVINAWQIFFGAVFLLPVSLLFNDVTRTDYDAAYYCSVLWLAIPVTIGAVQLWFVLLGHDAVKASLWLFACPIFGFFYAYGVLEEPVTAWTFAGTALVLVGLYLGQVVAVQRVDDAVDDKRR